MTGCVIQSGSEESYKKGISALQLSLHVKPNANGRRFLDYANATLEMTARSAVQSAGLSSRPSEQSKRVERSPNQQAQSLKHYKPQKVKIMPYYPDYIPNRRNNSDDNHNPGTVVLFFLIILFLIIFFLLALFTYYYVSNSGEPAAEPSALVGTDTGYYYDLTDADENDILAMENIPLFYNNSFGEKIIAPGAYGSYTFNFINSGDAAITYNLSFSCVNDYGINIVYKLALGSEYICGTEGEYVAITDLNLSGRTVGAGTAETYTLYWYWAHNDAVDTIAGVNAANYTLTLTVNTQAA